MWQLGNLLSSLSLTLPIIEVPEITNALVDHCNSRSLSLLIRPFIADIACHSYDWVISSIPGKR